MRTEQICMACHILHYGVISDIEEYFLLFFFLIKYYQFMILYQIFEIQDQSQS